MYLIMSIFNRLRRTLFQIVAAVIARAKPEAIPGGNFTAAKHLYPLRQTPPLRGRGIHRML